MSYGWLPSEQLENPVLYQFEDCKG